MLFLSDPTFLNLSYANSFAMLSFSSNLIIIAFKYKYKITYGCVCKSEVHMTLSSSNITTHHQFFCSYNILIKFSRRILDGITKRQQKHDSPHIFLLKSKPHRILQSYIRIAGDEVDLHLCLLVIKNIVAEGLRWFHATFFHLHKNVHRSRMEKVKRLFFKSFPQCISIFGRYHV